MRYRNPKTGEMFDGIHGAQAVFCATHGFDCRHRCFLREHIGSGPCYTWCKEYPDEAARLMGYEVIGDSSSDSSTGIDEPPTDSTTTLDDTPTINGDTPTKEDNMCKMDKPRLAEVLGVEVGEKFSVDMGGFIMNNLTLVENGLVKYCNNDEKDVPIVILCHAINHPEGIIRAPRLMEAELAICKAVGAKWVSKNKCGARRVTLWDGKPIFDEGMFSITEDDEHSVTIGVIGRISDVLFPSVHPGDCICVEEATP